MGVGIIYRKRDAAIVQPDCRATAAKIVSAKSCTAKSVLWNRMPVIRCTVSR